MSRTNKKYDGGTKGSGTRARSGTWKNSGDRKRIGTRDRGPIIDFIPELDEKAI